MVRRVFQAGFLIMTAFAASGCATSLLLDAAREPVVKEYVASHAQSAWRDESGLLVVCLSGRTPGRAATEPAESYSIAVGMDRFETLAVEGEEYDARTIMIWQAPQDSVETPCRDRPQTASPVDVQRVEMIPPDGGADALQSLHDLLAPADLDYSEPVIYSFDNAGGAGGASIVYQHEAPLPGGARFVRIDPPYEEDYEYNAAIFLMPLAVTVDIAVGLAILYLCTQTSGSC